MTLKVAWMLWFKLISVLLWPAALSDAADVSGNRLVSIENTAELSSSSSVEEPSEIPLMLNTSNSALIELTGEDGFSSESNETSASEHNFTSTRRRPHFEFKPQFEHSTYDFMVPEGSNPKSTNLAVISYMGKKDKPMPKFKISFDRMRWFEIGEVALKELDDYIEYKVMINQRADVYVQYSLTKNGSYKFSIEAHDSGTMQTASIHVDVLSLSPTTRRRSTTPSTSTTPATTTVTEKTTPSDILHTTASTSTHLAASENSSDASSDTSATEVPSMKTRGATLPTTRSMNSSEALEESSGDDGSIDQDITLVISSEGLSKEVSGEQHSSTEVAKMKTAKSKEDSAELLLASSTEATGGALQMMSVAQGSTTSEADSSSGSSTLKESTLDVIDSSDNSLLKSGESTEDDSNHDNASMRDKSTEEKVSSMPSLTTTPESATTKKDVEELELVFEGDDNGAFTVEESLGKGDLIRGLSISIKTSPQSKNSYTKLWLDQTDAVEIRPKLLFTGNKAYLFIKETSLFSSPVTVRVMAERSNSVTVKELTLTANPRKASLMSESEESTKIGAAVEYHFTVSEDASSGLTVGQIKDGESMRIVGPPGLFSLLGSDLILSCPSEGSCLDYEKEQMHHVLLVDALGKRSPPVYVKISVEDVNDNRPSLDASDSVIRLSNNRLIMPFVVQVLDKDDPTTSENRLTLSGAAANFLGLKEISKNLYQVDVIGFAPAGHHQLQITVSDGISTSDLTIEVHVQNSRSRAHFRKTKYSRSITADKVHQGNQLVHVELEGVPIDEARFVILQGNPGWLTIDDYGGRVGVAKMISPVETGHYMVEIGAVDRESNALLAQTQLEIKVVGGVETEKKVFAQTFFGRSLDRESSTEFTVPFKVRKGGSVKVSSVFAIDEDGQQREFKKKDVTIGKRSVVFKKDALANLRAITAELSSGGEKATVMLYLTSTAEYIENRLKESTRPRFPHPWSRESPVVELSIPEELPVGHVVYTLPAVNPLDGTPVPVVMEGDMKDYFELDADTGAILISRRIDADSMEPSDRVFSLKFTAGSVGYESEAELRITLLNIDDNAPALDKEGLNNEVPIPENLPPSTVIARLQVVDRDELGKVDAFTVEKSGVGSELYSAAIVNGSLVVKVADNGTLDRERMERQTVHLTVRDLAGNQDSVTLHILLLDVNDNAPRFTEDQFAMQLVDNWPAGIVFDRLTATDADAGKNGRITYSIASGNKKYFTIDPMTGELSVAQELTGAAREQPYEIVVVAEDSGVPSMSSSVRIKLKVSEPSMEKEGEKGQVHFVDPPVEFVLKLNEDTPVNEHVYVVKAKLVGINLERANIKYSLKDISGLPQHFDIDESSGEVYVTKPLDYEHTKFYTVHQSATLDMKEEQQVQWTFNS